MEKMMDTTEVKHEFAINENQCCVCLSVGRNLSLLGDYIHLFIKITDGVEYPKPLEELLLCWECQAILRKAQQFLIKVAKANELFQLEQTYIYGSQSSLTTIIFSDSHPHTIYINDDSHTEKEVKSVNIIDDDLGANDFDDECHAAGDDCVKDEAIQNVNTEQNKLKSNRWATKRALQNKKPKFKIITEYNKDSFRRVQIDDQALKLCMAEERDSEYYKSKRFKCDKCVLVFANENLFNKHYKKFHINKPASYTCDICTSNISNKDSLSRHISKHYYKFVCTLCDFSCHDKSQARWHYQRRHRKVFQCLKCGLKFGSRKDFYKHYKEWHEKYICDHCGVSFKMRYCIKDHIRKQHSPFECKPCNKRWARYNGLWLHNKTTHGVNKQAYCVECDRQYRDIYRYRWHLANSARHKQHKKQRIPCPGCDKVFSKNIYMKDHYNLVHLKFYKYRCEQCDKNFIRNADLVKHTRRVHEGILPPKNKICYMCGRGFSTNKILTNHLRTHTGEKPFSCSVCGARFTQSAALAAHARHIHHHTDKQPN